MNINLMKDPPKKNGQYLVAVREPMGNTTYFGNLPHKMYWKVCDYVVTARYVGESHKVPYWDTDHSELSICWIELPKLNVDHSGIIIEQIEGKDVQP